MRGVQKHVLLGVLKRRHFESHLESIVTACISMYVRLHTYILTVWHVCAL